MTASRIDIIGVPMDLGADRRGVDMGPSAIRYAGLERDLRDLGREVVDHHNLRVPGPEGLGQLGEATGGPKFVRQIEEACTELAEIVANVLRDGHFPLVLGGDHSIAIGSIAGVLRTNPECAVFWVDAHGDINTPETSPSGNVHGMPVAVVLGLTRLFASLGWAERKIAPNRLVLFGIRNLDSGEKRTLRSLGIKVVTMSDIDTIGIKAAVESALAGLGSETSIHLSLDMDAMDPLQAPGVATPSPGGLTYREAHLAMELLAASGRIRSMEVVEVNPIADQANQTAKFAEELILSALGRTIL